MKRRNRGRKDH